jgi:serine/threonine-protein kinase HipA
MPDVSILEVHLHGKPIATLTNVQGDRIIFAFNQSYVDDQNRARLSLSFKDSLGGIITKVSPVQRVVPPFFSNVLPEGPLRKYLAERAGVNPEREFFLLWMLGRDLPGAVSVRPLDGDALPLIEDGEPRRAPKSNALRFSLAGVQLKFSALLNEGKGRGLTIPAEGAGGSWIVKLPSQQFSGVPENEFSMMTFAGMLGMDVPDMRLVDLNEIEGLPAGLGEFSGQAYAIRRFDRGPDGPVHIEDFAQVFGVFPEQKYQKASYRLISRVLGVETGAAGVAEFIRRLVFNTLIGNADMHLKNWSLIYPDGRTPALSPAYDFVSTIPYLPDSTTALNFSRTKEMTKLSRDELVHLAGKAALSEKLVIDTTAETVARFRETWHSEKTNLPLARNVIEAIDAHAPTVPIYNEF